MRPGLAIDTVLKASTVPLCWATLVALPSTVAANNTITTFAGNGAATSSGDGGPATNAAINWPYAMAWTAGGTMLVAEVTGNRVREIAADGTITTVAGNGSGGGAGGADIFARGNQPAGSG